MTNQERMVEYWNSHHPVGTHVEVVRDNGTIQRTKTRSKAQMLAGHTAVVWLDGIAGCYSLERCRPYVPDLPNETLVDRDKEATRLVSEFMRMIDESLLVRNINGDAEPDWAVKMIPLVKLLADAKAFLAAQEQGK